MNEESSRNRWLKSSLRGGNYVGRYSYAKCPAKYSDFYYGPRPIPAVNRGFRIIVRR